MENDMFTEDDIFTIEVVDEDGNVCEEAYELLFTLPHKDPDKEYVIFTDVGADEEDDEEELNIYKAVNDMSSGKPFLHSVTDEEESKALDAMITEMFESMMDIFDDDDGEES